MVVAIVSEGTAPVLTREIKTRLEEMLAQNLGGLAALAGRFRPSVEAWVAAAAIKAAIAAGRPPEGAAKGHVALVGAGPGSRDLLTLLAVERLQETDVIFYDRLVDKAVLELAHRDAERVFVGKHVGAHAWPQDRSPGGCGRGAKGPSGGAAQSGGPWYFWPGGRRIGGVERVRYIRRHCAGNHRSLSCGSS